MEMSQKMESCHQGRGVGGRQPLHCYIRRDKSTWTEGRRHHAIALDSYLSLHVKPLDPGEIPKGAVISTEHDDGGLFYAYFIHIKDDMYQYLDRYGKIVQITMETPLMHRSCIAHVNRIFEC